MTTPTEYDDEGRHEMDATPAADPTPGKRTQPPPIPTPTERASMLRKVYRYFHLYGCANETDWLIYETAIAELTGLGYTLTADETDWVLKETDHE